MLPISRPTAPIVLSLLLVVTGCISTGNADERSQSRGSRGGYVITAEEIEASGQTSITELLIARVPGVRRAPGGDGIILRGPDSVNASSEPLFVIDGVPSAAGARNLNIYDIAEIEVLSDMGSTAGYGMQGVSGVILIRTKSSGQ